MDVGAARLQGRAIHSSWKFAASVRSVSKAIYGSPELVSVHGYGKRRKTRLYISSISRKKVRLSSAFHAPVPARAIRRWLCRTGEQRTIHARKERLFILHPVEASAGRLKPIGWLHVVDLCQFGIVPIGSIFSLVMPFWHSACPKSQLHCANLA